MASQNGSDSDSDVYVGARRNALTKKQRRQQLQVAAGLAPPSHAEVRFSTRRAAKVQTYNEDDDLGLSEEESDTMTPSYYAAAAEDNSPAIDIVLKHKLKEDTGKHTRLKPDVVSNAY